MTNLRPPLPTSGSGTAARPPWRLIAGAGLIVATVGTWVAARPGRPDAATRGPVEELLSADPRVAGWRDQDGRRNEVVRAVLAGELGLLPAAARFRDLTAGDPETVAHLRRVYPGATDDERHARAVIARVRIELTRLGKDGRPADRLEEELARLRAAGPVTLPVPAGLRTE